MLYKERICLLAAMSRGATNNIIIIVNGCSDVSGPSATFAFAEEVDGEDEDKKEDKTEDAGNDDTDKLPSGESTIANSTRLSRSQCNGY